MINIVIKAIFLLLSFTQTEVITSEAAAYQYAEPSYAKWGKLAMQETAKAYGDASIIDYKYEGRKTLSSGESEESFVLLLKKDAKKFSVCVTFRVRTDSDKLIDVKMKELMN